MYSNDSHLYTINEHTKMENSTLQEDTPLKSLLKKLSQENDQQKISKIKLKTRLDLLTEKLSTLQKENDDMKNLTNKLEFKLEEKECLITKLENRVLAEKNTVEIFRRVRQDMEEDFQNQRAMELGEMRKIEKLNKVRIKVKALYLLFFQPRTRPPIFFMHIPSFHS